MIEQLLKSWGKFLLLELDYNEIKSKLDGDKFANSAKYHGVSPEEAKKSIMKTLILNSSTGQELDISDQDKANYLNWRIKQFMTKGSYVGPDPQSVETFYHIKAQKLDRFLKKNDINSFESVEEFDKIVSDAKIGYDSYVAEKSKKSRKGNWIELPSGVSFEIPKDARLVAEDEDWLVYIPDTKGASIGLGLYTSWCTAAPGLNYYHQYHKPEDPLLVFISKNQKYSKKVVASTKEEITTDDSGREKKVKHKIKKIIQLPVRYQFNFGREQFKDVRNNDLEKELVYGYENPIVIRFLALLNKNSEKLPKYVQAHIKGYTMTSLPNGGKLLVTPEKKEYFNSKNKLHREDGPARIIDNDYKQSEEWFKNGVLDRSDGPAFIEKDEYYTYETWYKKGVIHRIDGPAYVKSEDGVKKIEKWFIDGNELTKVEFDKALGKINKATPKPKLA